MFKKILAGCGAGLLIVSASVALADVTGTPREPMTATDASMSSDLMGQILNSIESASIDLQFTGSIDSDKGLIIDTLNAPGMIKFNSDWQVKIGGSNSKGDESSTSSDEMGKVMPILKMDAKNLMAAVSIETKADITNMQLDFYGSYDKKKKKLVPRPLTLSASNQFNKDLMSLKFNWIRVKIKMSQDPTKPSLIKGTCSSEKLLLDITTGQNRTVPVQCEFAGTYSETGGYKVNFKYVNASPAGTSASTKSEMP